MSSPPSGPPEAALSVAAVARRLGIAPATLRTWDRRYDLGPSGHTAGSHRRYTPDDLERLTLMRRLTLDGVAPAEAARVALATDLTPAREEDGLRTEQGSPAVASVTALVPAAVPPRTPQVGGQVGGGRVLAMPGGTAASRGLARAAMALDDYACAHLLRSALKSSSVVETWEEMLAPVLVGVGERWAETGEGIEVEHLLAEVAMTVFRPLGAEVASPVNGRPVLLACMEEEQHSLPLYVFAAALAEQRVSSRLLGARVPGPALQAAVRRSGPSVVVLWSQLSRTAHTDVIGSLPTQRPAPVVFTGGPGWTGRTLPAGAQHLDSLRGGVAAVLGAVTARRH